MIHKQELFDYEEFVPYEEALELKELGFNEPCIMQWTYAPELIFCTSTWAHPKLKTNKESYSDSGGDCISAPTFSQAFRWFRKKHDLVHHINRDGGWWLCSILNLYDEEDQGAIETHIDNCYPDSYEESELACLKEIIKIVKRL